MPTTESRLAAAARRLAGAEGVAELWPLLPEDTWLVGGCVRDAVLGRPLHDVDLVVPEPVAALCRGLARRLGATHVVLDEVFDSHRLILAGGSHVDLTRQQGVTLDEDLRRRDMTINAVAFRWPSDRAVGDGCWRDPCGGLDDMAAGRLRSADPENWRADPLRLVRLYRLAAELGFALPEDTRAEVRSLAPLLEAVPGERLWTELLRLVAAADGERCWQAMGEDGMLAGLGWPEAGRAWRAADPPLAPVARIRIQAVAPEAVLEQLADRLRWSRAERRGALALVRALEVWQALPAEGGVSRLRWLYRLREALRPLGLESAAELRAVAGGDQALACCLAEVADPALRPLQPPLLRGDQIVARSGRSPGPWLGRLLEALAEEQAVGTLADADGAWTWVEARLSGASPEGAA